MRVLVVGAGIFGVTAALELRARGHEVELFDRGAIPGPAVDASSNDSSRAVRMDYGDDAFYVDLAREAWERWRGPWGLRLGPVYHEVGFLFASAARFEDAPGGFEALSYRELHARGARVERLSRADVERRVPAFSSAAWVDGYWSRDAGYANAGAVTRALQAQALEAGCGIHSECRVVDLGEREAASGRAWIRTDAGERFDADALLVAAGAWSSQIVPALSGALVASAQTVLYFEAPSAEVYRGEVYPTWAWDIAGAGWYGFPLCSRGLAKIAHHGAGRRHTLDAERVQEVSVDPGVERAARVFLQGVLPGLASARLAEARVCHYCDSVDGQFWIDRVPDASATFVATGGSGHGFKFAPILGELIANRIEGRVDPRLDRFAWRVPIPKRERARSDRSIDE